jgi:hypothetical protein
MEYMYVRIYDIAEPSVVQQVLDDLSADGWLVHTMLQCIGDDKYAPYVTLLMERRSVGPPGVDPLTGEPIAEPVAEPV